MESHDQQSSRTQTEQGRWSRSLALLRNRCWDCKGQELTIHKGYVILHFLTMLYCAILCCIFAILCIFYWRMHSTRCSFGVSASQPADCKHCDHCFSISGPHLSSYHINIVYVLFTWCFPTAAVLWQREVECSQKCPEPWPSLCVSFCEEPQNATVDEPPRRRFTAGLVALGVAGIAGLGGLVGSCRIMSVLVLFLVTGWAPCETLCTFLPLFLREPFCQPLGSRLPGDNTI